MRAYPMKTLVCAAALFAVTALASAAEMPAAFQGRWIEHDATNSEIKWAVDISPRTYHMPGMDCTINKVSNKPDSQFTNARVLIVDMTCSDEGYHAPAPTKVRETWAIRDGILVTATPSSISVMQRGTMSD